jgi:hypothetical protein
VQAEWLRTKLAASTTPWQIVYFHESPYSSGSDSGSTRVMQWPFAAWGADLMLSAHDHNYERLFVGGLTYLVAGTGGAPLRAMNPLVPGSQVTYNEYHGALLIEGDIDSLRAEFRSIAHGETVVDCVVIGSPVGHQDCSVVDSPPAEVGAAANAHVAARIRDERMKSLARPHKLVAWRDASLHSSTRRVEAAASGESSRDRLVAEPTRRTRGVARKLVADLTD